MEDLSYSCIACKKDYGTYKNLWAHNKSRHNGIKTVKVAYKPEELFQCRKCNNVFNHVQSRHTHEKSCCGIVRTELDVEFENLRAINQEKVKVNNELEKKLQCLRDESIREIKMRKKQNEGMKEFIREEKEQRSRIENEIKEEKQERKEEKQRIENEIKEEKQERKEEIKEEVNRIKKVKQETQLKLRDLLLNINQTRIQNKFC
jgi:hypothetical protein